MIKDILVNLSYGTSQDGVSNYALSVAETFGAHIVGTAFAYPVMASGVGFSTSFLRAQQPEAQERAESVAAAFDEASHRAGVSAETRRLEAGIGDVPSQFAHIARRFDLSVIGQFESGRDHPTKNIVIEAALFESGRPVLIVPFIQKDRLKLDHVMVCWDGSRAPRERSPMPCRFSPAPARRVLLLRTLRAPKAQTFRVRISRPI
jgi:hypothetical protein